MKKIFGLGIISTLPICFILISASTLWGQTINFNEPSGEGCGFNTQTLVLTGTDATGRNTYASPGDVSCSWNNSLMRWEFTGSALMELICFSTFASTPNPPDDATGNYQAANYFGTGCVDLGIINIGGSGTQNFLGGAAPVELISFKAKIAEQGVRLEWETNSESNNEKFLIEHSFDAQQFVVIGEVKGRGTTNEPQQYRFQHRTAAIGENYYRLKQLDFNGDFEYSNFVGIYYQPNLKDQTFRIFPNPVSNYLNYTVEDLSKVLEVKLRDLNGKLIKNADQINGYLSMHDLASGLYVITLKTKAGSSQQLIVKQ